MRISIKTRDLTKLMIQQKKITIFPQKPVLAEKEEIFWSNSEVDDSIYLIIF